MSCGWTTGHHGVAAAGIAGREPHPQAPLADVEHGKDAQDQQGAAQIDHVLAGGARHLEHAGLHLLEVLELNTSGAG
jgi:hypothetical protein